MRNGRDTFALGRRISKQVEYSGDWDCTYHYYYDGQRMIETRDVNNQVLKQHVWGLTYVDELVQIAINQDPENATIGTNTENLCERFFWALQDANFNVMAVVNSTGIVVERYEYTPYGQRTIFGRDWLATDADEDGTVNLGDWSKLAIEFEESGYEASTSDTTGDGIVNLSDQSQMSFDWGKCWAPADDPLASYPRLETTRGRAALTTLAVGLCDVGHQGLHFNREFGLYGNRARYYHPRVGRFVQRDPSGYADGMSLYQYVQGKPTMSRDPSGLAPNPTWKTASGCGGIGEPDPVYDKRMMDEMWNRAMYHYDCLHKLHGRTNCPPVRGGHKKAYKWWLKKHEDYRDQYNSNKEGGKGIYLCDYYDLRVTCAECTKSGKVIAAAVCEKRLHARFLKYEGQAGVKAVEKAKGAASIALALVLVKRCRGRAKLIAIPFFAYGALQMAKAGDVIGKAADIKQTYQDAMAKYCNCDNVVK